MDQGTQEHTITAFWHCVLILEITRAALHLDKSTHRLDDNIYRTYMQLDDKYKEYGYDSGQGDFAERISSLIYRIEGRFSSEPVDGAVPLSTPEVTKLIYDIDVRKLSDAIVDNLKRKVALWLQFKNIDKVWTTHDIASSDLIT